MIVGTIGHSGHGKTALVKALAGIGGDRLPEEKRCGSSIVASHAFMPTAGGEVVAFIDMPGHPNRVSTMIAGASGIDFALLVVAADEGISPLTREHLDIVAMLGIGRGAAVLSKSDRADSAVIAQRLVEVRTLLAETGLRDFPVLALSTSTGEGLENLRALLLAEAARPTPAQQTAALPAGFRMGLDRVFTFDGTGTIVTGSIAAGEVRAGDMLCLAHAPAQTYRVHSLHSHHRSLEVARAGQLCAIGLAGLEHGIAKRGHTVCDPAIGNTTARLDVCLQLSASEAHALASLTSVFLHVGAGRFQALVTVLGQPSVEPGNAALVQLTTRAPVQAWQGQRFVLRDASGSRTIGGGTILDTHAPARYRQTAQRLRYLHAQRHDDVAERLCSAVAMAPYGLDSRAWLRSAGLLDWPFDPATLQDADFDQRREWVISRQRLANLGAHLETVLQAFHQQAPDDIGPDPQRARRMIFPNMPVPLWQRLVQRLVADGRLVQRNGFLHLPEHGIELLAAERVVAERALPMLLAGGFDPPWVRDIAKASGLLEGQVRQVLARLAKGGDVYQIVKDLYYHPQRVLELAALARTLAEKQTSGPLAHSITAASFRDATGLGRKRAIQILEFFDRIAFLRRIGDAHLLRPGTTMFLPRELEHEHGHGRAGTGTGTSAVPAT